MTEEDFERIKRAVEETPLKRARDVAALLGVSPRDVQLVRGRMGLGPTRYRSFGRLIRCLRRDIGRMRDLGMTGEATAAEGLLSVLERACAGPPEPIDRLRVIHARMDQRLMRDRLERADAALHDALEREPTLVHRLSTAVRKAGTGL